MTATMTVSRVDSEPISAVDARRLHNADQLCFDWFIRDGKAGIRAIRSAEPGQRDDITFDIPCGAYISDYANMYTSEPLPERRRCFEMIHSVKYSDTARTMVAFVKAGDVLTMEWSADIYGPDSSVRQAGLHADELTLHIARGRTRYAFLVSVRTGEDNSARMIGSGMY